MKAICSQGWTVHKPFQVEVKRTCVIDGSQHSVTMFWNLLNQHSPYQMHEWLKFTKFLWIEDYWSDPEYRNRINHWITEYKIGSLHANFGTVEETTKLFNVLQEMSEVPLLFCHGGSVSIWNATPYPYLMALGAINRTDEARSLGRILGREDAAMGFHYISAPVVDVNINPDNPIINVRSLGETPAMVAELAESFIRGVQESGLTCQAKHYPGHGDTEQDSHLTLPVVNASRSRLEAVEWFPYRYLIQQDILHSIMTAQRHERVVDVHFYLTFPISLCIALFPVVLGAFYLFSISNMYTLLIRL